MSFELRIDQYSERVERFLENALPDPDQLPRRLHEAMRYSVLGGGKRLRPLLVYASGEALEVETKYLDAPAASIELMHAFSLIHDDLPAMDDDDLRRGRPSTHKAFDEAIAILAADALQPLAFEVLARDPALVDYPESQLGLIALVADACGSTGMTGGQAIDMAAEGHRLGPGELENMYRLKTGRLLQASVLAATWCPPRPGPEVIETLTRFIDCMGLAFQIRDDILDIEGSTAQIGKQRGADIARHKATYPAIMGIDAARTRTQELLKQSLGLIEKFGAGAEGLRWLARYVVLRES